MTVRRLLTRLAIASATLTLPTTAAAQGVDGYASIAIDRLPAVDFSPDRSAAVSELRARLFIERRIVFGPHLKITAAGFIDGLLADRGQPVASRAAIVRPQELHLEAAWAHADLRVGMSRVTWGRLDEFLPTDVVNPLDLARFFLEGRAEARLPVAMVRARWLPSDRLTVEGVYAPLFRRGTFDQLDEATSPFTIAPPLPRALEPRRGWRSAQGGVRASVTSGRVDWSATAYRGFDPGPAVLPERYTMIGGDFETVRGPWGVRGEMAVFDGRETAEAGIGVDRRAGEYRISGSVLVAERWAASAARDRRDLTVVASLDRSFARETRTLRVFTVYNPGEASAFARVVSIFNLLDNLSVEASAGLFTGDGSDVLSRFATRDFLSARCKVYF
ncbi:MAG TPA: DUF1302 family protein [Vicinamibacterales bacterium]|nr:DUF1302 family protein [Vicinamibacterales bacterium]